jgi:hypothetical protein
MWCWSSAPTTAKWGFGEAAGRGDVDDDLDRLQAVLDAVDPGRGSPSAPALGETAADLALEVHTNRDLKAFALARFAGGRVPRPAMMI